MQNSILSVPWDLRSLWYLFSGISRIYLSLLFALALFTCWQCLRTTLHKSNSAIVEIKKWRDTLHQALTLMLFLFGVTLSNEIFSVLRAASLSRSSLSEFSLQAALEAVTALAFVVFNVLSFLHALVWATSAIVTVNERPR